ncbi:MAG: hypothetical protein AB7V26_14830 [Lysobacterales bacterium]
MRWPNWGLAVLVALAGIALWLLLAGPDRLLGLDSGNLGVALAATVAWGSIYGVSVAPRGALEESVSPGEWDAWIGLGFTVLVAVFLLAKADVIAAAADRRDLGAIGRSIVMLLIAWGILSWTLASRWRQQVTEDERDREITVRAAGWGRGALVFGVIGLIVLFGFSPADRLSWATPLVVAHLLILVLVAGSIVEYAVIGASYWRDRRP